MIEPIAGDYEGFRLFRVQADRLRSIATEYEYVPGVNLATCHAGKRHDVPARACTCGFWVYHHQHRALSQFEGQLEASVSSSYVAGVYGDFGLDDKEPTAVLGKVRGGGRAVIGDDGARLAHIEVVALVTTEPQVVTTLLGHYGIEAIPPALTSRGWIVDVTDTAVMLETPARDRETGLFTVEDAVDVPPIGTHVVIEFVRRGAMRHVVNIAHAPKARD